MSDASGRHPTKKRDPQRLPVSPADPWLEMEGFIAILGAALFFAVSDGSLLLTQLDGEKYDITCDAARFTADKEICEATFKLNIPHNHGDMKFVCAVIRKYKMCLANVIRATGCGAREFLVEQLQPMQQYLQENRIECVRQLNESSESGVPEGIRAKLDLCTRDKAWETQFLCAKKFHTKLKKIEEDKEVESHQICRALSRYYSCLNTVLHSESCEEDTELMMHMEYFPKVLTQKYREMCFAELKLTAMNVAKRLEGYVQDATCQEEDATKQFFACGLLFNEIVSHNPPKEKICLAYRNFQNCTEMITRDLHCSVGSDFNVHSMHVMTVLLSQYDSYCKGVAPIHPDTGGSVSPVVVTPLVSPEPPHPQGSCNENLYLEKYFECGLMYIFNLRDALYGDNAQYGSQVCDIVKCHKECTDMIKKTSNCPDPLGIQASLEYIDNELRTAHGQSCNNVQQKRTGKIRFRTSAEKCHIREFTGTYFTCGTIFIKNTYPNKPSKDEDCRFYMDFKKCISLLIVCNSASDIKTSLQLFTTQLTQGYEEMCKDYNLSVTCEKLSLIKNFFSCGLTYYQSYNEFGSSYLGAKPHACNLVDDFSNCTTESVLKNDCKELKTMFDHISNIRKYIVQLFNKRHPPPSCNVPTSAKKKRVYLGLERQSSCDQFKAVKKLVLCGVTFHRMLVAAGNTSALVGENQTAVCPLVKEMKYCMYSATHDSGCSDALLLNTEISVLKKYLLMEFEDTCNAIPSAEDKEFSLSRQACELKEFTQDWETCDSAMEDDISLFYRNGSAFRKNVRNNRVRRRLCGDLIGYRKCLNESAEKHHCSAVAPQMADMSNELFDRLGLMYCSGGSRVVSRWGVFLAAAGAASLLIRQAA